jgi:hypothetical protein
MYPESNTLQEQHTPTACGGVVDSPPDPDKLVCRGGLMERTSRPGRYRLYIQEKHVAISVNSGKI